VNVEVHVSELVHLPRIRGAHELSWSYLLDAMFADAYHAGVTRLLCFLPTAELADAVALRADLTRPGPGACDCIAIADFAGRGITDPDAKRRYRLSFGILAPRSLRSQTKPPPQTGDPLSVLSVFTLTARLWGLPLRTYSVAHFARRYDLASVAMRRRFASTGKVPAFYHLSTWGNP